ncbi:MAG: metalloregulator ArsR/SmtB family transcription factor [Armatimonadetes bacterium]|nr:metalloregulator ArsR/SmtB family transcription factor [Armatimonadota bacterium]
MSTYSLRQQVLLLQAVADPNRLRILGCLFVRPACVCELVQATGLPQSRISRHLQVLRNAGLVQDRREAQWVEYSVVSAPEGSPQATILRLVEQLLAGDAVVQADRERLATAVRGRGQPSDEGTPAPESQAWPSSVSKREKEV